MDDADEEGVVETDPTGRFERYNQSLGKGAFKEVFKAFDQEEGVEVAWNQLRLDNFNPRDVQRILTEIQILESLRDENIINLYYSWVVKGKDGNRKVIFITELMTSGTMKSYLRKTKGVVKHKTLLRCGLAYLHTRVPSVIHRDLKCQNIFVNGNSGQAKIGDLGLAAIKNREHMSSVLGTPEFMAPELYDELYDEKVDIYAFGMVVIEIVTKDYPYSECQNQAQIFKKVSSGIKPLALQKITDIETRNFVELCISFDAKGRPSAQELLAHPFLQAKDNSILSTMNSTYSLFDDSIQSPSKESMSLEVMKAASHPMEIFAPLNASPPRFKSPIISFSKLETSVSDIQLPLVDVVGANKHTYIVHRLGIPTVVGSQIPSDLVLTVEEAAGSTETDLQLKMIYKETENINFPFNLKNDTATDVISEMVCENLIEADHQHVARRKLEELIRHVMFSKSTAAAAIADDAIPPEAFRLVSSPTFPKSASSGDGVKIPELSFGSDVHATLSDPANLAQQNNPQLILPHITTTAPCIPKINSIYTGFKQRGPNSPPQAKQGPLPQKILMEESAMSSVSSIASRPQTPMVTLNPTDTNTKFAIPSTGIMDEFSYPSVQLAYNPLLSATKPLYKPGISSSSITSQESNLSGGSSYMTPISQYAEATRRMMSPTVMERQLESWENSTRMAHVQHPYSSVGKESLTRELKAEDSRSLNHIKDKV